MGSQLCQATEAYSDKSGSAQTFEYDDTVWLDLGTLLGGVTKLEMHKIGNTYRDKDDKIIVADGTVNFLGCTPYDDFIDWCEDQGIDWFVYDYDWRRPMDETATYFLQTFLPHFRQAVSDGCNGADPLADFVLVGHSFGGMLIKLMLNSADPLLTRMTSAVTVGSPFYGYGGLMMRWCEGDPLISLPSKKAVIRTISSLPGCYALCYLDEVTFGNFGAQLAADPNYPLNDFPSEDAQNPAQNADPYNPDPGRYPTDLGFSPQMLQAGRLIYREIAKPVPNSQLAARFFNIRGVKKRTEGGVKWGKLPVPPPPPPPYDPDNNSPLDYVMQKRGPGDGTQPAWTTRLVTQPPGNCIVVTGDIDHMFLMESSEVQARIADILWPTTAQMMVKGQPAKKSTIKPASIDETTKFIERLQTLRAKPDAVERYVNSLPLGQLKGLARRIMMDIMKGTSRAGHPSDKRKRRHRVKVKRARAPGLKTKSATAGKARVKSRAKTKKRTRRPGGKGRAR